MKLTCILPLVILNNQPSLQQLPVCVLRPIDNAERRLEGHVLDCEFAFLFWSFQTMYPYLYDNSFFLIPPK